MGKLIAVVDTGPIIHLPEVNCLSALNIFKKIILPMEVMNELKKTPSVSQVEVARLNEKEKDLAAWIAVKYELDLAEAEAIAICKARKINLFLTDDLDARIAATVQGLEPHGSVGVILRAFRECILTKEQTTKALKGLETNSTLFITRSLVQQAIDAVNKYSRLKRKR